MLPQRVFSGISLSIASRIITAIVGEEGAGKSTLLQVLAGLLTPDSGNVLIDDLEPKHHEGGWRGVRRRMGISFQFPEQQFFRETVLDELVYTCRQYRIALPDELSTAGEVLNRMHLDTAILQRSPFSLSMGEARRVAIASMLLHNPDTFLLDEPTAGLDVTGRGVVLALLRDLRNSGRTIVLATHDHSIIAAIADAVVVMKENPLLVSLDEYLADTRLNKDLIY